MSKKVDLSSYDNSFYKPGIWLKIISWYCINELVLKNSLLPFSILRIIVLRCFGAKIGIGVTIKPGVSVKYPWFLVIGDHCWIGENVWIDNLTNISIGDNVCISQGAILLCGNHNYKKYTFDLITKPIVLEEGVWVGAKSMVCPGVTLKSHSVLCVGSVANRDLEAYCVYMGNPALKIKERKID
jgi:putative colanic acid biosynthesis acetyltransferase WcaF